MNIQIGRTYIVHHARKGTFKVRITAMDEDFTTGTLVDSNPREMSNDRGDGDAITFRTEFATFLEEQE